MRIPLFLVALFTSAVSIAANTSIISAGSSWKYLDDGSDQGTTWRSPSFNDAGWKTGTAQFGYGDGDEATIVGFGPFPYNRHITTYFRRSFTVADPLQFKKLILNLLYDDGAIVYINGVEVARANMFPGPVTYRTWAASILDPPDENTFFPTHLSPTILKAGTNVIAVEVHQGINTSIDLSFDLSLTGSDAPPALIRGPYLQTVTTNSIFIRWRTDLPTDSRVLYGTSPGVLNRTADDPSQVTEHIVKLTGLLPDTRYYYSVGSTSTIHAGNDVNHYFITSPPTGTERPLRIWAMSDCQYGGYIARMVRNAYAGFNGSTRTDVWLTMGDNSQTGEDADYQTKVFDMFPSMLRNTVLWPAIGNHDTNESETPPASAPYFRTFTVPVNGEAGGVPSGSQRYYSFDYGNVHFIALDSMSSDRSPSGPMLTWLRNDLAATRQRWIIAYWHHAPYSRGTHDSDIEPRMADMRRNALPILEAGGADLVLAGHSHVYERSFLLNGHYGQASSFTSTMKLNAGDGRVNGNGAYTKAGVNAHEGTVYVVAGTGSAPGSLMSTRHPAIYTARDDAGSLVIDVNGSQLDVKFVLANATVWDYFTIRKDATNTRPAPPANLNAVANNQTGVISLSWTDASGNEAGFHVERAPGGTNFVRIAELPQNATAYTDTAATPGVLYNYRVRAHNTAGTSDYSNTASAMVSVALPAAPTNLAAAATSGTQVNLTWTDNAANESGYRVWRATETSSFVLIATLPANTKSYSSTGLTPNTTYYFRVAAYNSAGQSSPAGASAKTSTTPPPAPSQLNIFVLSGSAIRLEWRDNAQGQAQYIVERASGSGLFNVVAALIPGTIVWTDSGLQAATRYTYRVKARNSAGDSGYSNTASGTTRRR
jgi:acid phosphatase type 7